jgi:hypothetical protein
MRVTKTAATSSVPHRQFEAVAQFEFSVDVAEANDALSAI